MKNNDIDVEKKPYVFVIVVLVILALAVLIIIKLAGGNNNESSDNSNKPISERKQQVIKKKTSFFALQNMVNTFVSYNSNESIYGLLDKDYISENGVTINNAKDIAHQGESNLSFKMQKFSIVDMSDVNKNVYIINGILIINGFGYQEVVDKDYSIILLIDYDNLAYSVIPDSDEIPDSLKSKTTFTIDRNEYNKMPSISAKSRYDYCNLYYNDFVFKVNYLLDDAKKLVSEESEVNIDTFDYKKAFSNSPTIKTCSYDSDIRRYSIEDTNGNSLYIKERSIMDYTVYLK